MFRGPRVERIANDYGREIACQQAEAVPNGPRRGPLDRLV
jgi:hypothetical protein